jgi:hypothetical protein
MSPLPLAKYPNLFKLLLSILAIISTMPPRLLHFKVPQPNSMCIRVASTSRLSPDCPTLVRQAIIARDLKRMRTNGGRTLATAAQATYSGTARVSRHGKLPPQRWKVIQLLA